MKRFRVCVVPGLLLLGLAGCGDSAVNEGPVPFKPTDTQQFDQMKQFMIGNVKNPGPKKGTDKPAPATEKKN